MISIIASSAPGLSPLARGTLYAASFSDRSSRFIPAGAGNTTPATCFASRSAVYPRWRGEHAPCNLCAADSAGLSPLARGTPIIPAGIERLSRFSPAGAGNTSFCGCLICHQPVYPRWRGEHYRKESANGDRGGLSPLARGTH